MSLIRNVFQKEKKKKKTLSHDLSALHDSHELKTNNMMIFFFQFI